MNLRYDWTAEHRRFAPIAKSMNNHPHDRYKFTAKEMLAGEEVGSRQ